MIEREPSVHDNERKLRAVFVDALGLAPGVVVEALSYRGVPEWDSVAHMQLVAAIEAAFDIMLDTAEVIAMSSYAVARATAIRHGVELEP